MMLLALSENFEREDLTALEEGNGFLRLSEEFHMGQEEIAAFVGEERKTRIDRGYVRNRLKAAQLARQHPTVKTLLEAKPDVSLRALGYLDDEVDDRGRQFILDRLGQDGWSADTVAEAIRVLKAGGEDAENLLRSQGRTLAQSDAASRHAAMPAQEVVADAPVIHNGANGHEPSDEAAQAVKRSGLLADALKRVRRYATAVGEAVVTGDEHERLAELASIVNHILERV
jgi:ParB-like chromosome segregation protein Spo0J